MILGYRRLCELVEAGAIATSIDKVQAASVNVTLQPTILVEDQVTTWNSTLDPFEPDTSMRPHDMSLRPYILAPKEFILGALVEPLKVPANVAMEFRLRSSFGRFGIDHCLSVWVDPGFEGDLTIEIVNQRKHRSMLLYPYMDVGQLIVHQLDDRVPDAFLYCNHSGSGRYRNQTGPRASKGISRPGEKAERLTYIQRFIRRLHGN
jgi:deoxycytidine triphosphate deaminase